MKCYNWINSYTAGGQNASIQVAHAQVGMIDNFLDNSEIRAWMKDKTTVVLKGGNHKSMVELAELLEMGYIPWYAFRESMDAGNGIMTCVGCLPTERLIKAAAALRRIGTKGVIFDDNSLYMKKLSSGEYFGIERKYKDLHGTIQVGIHYTVSKLSEILGLESFTPWETELIQIIANGRTS